RGPGGDRVRPQRQEGMEHRGRGPPVPRVAAVRKRGGGVAPARSAADGCSRQGLTRSGERSLLSTRAQLVLLFGVPWLDTAWDALEGHLADSKESKAVSSHRTPKNAKIPRRLLCSAFLW